MASRTIRFENGFNGELLLDEGSVKIGRTPGGAAPYDMLYGALASCLYATFLGILEKKRIEIEGTEIVVEGEKRTERIRKTRSVNPLIWRRNTALSTRRSVMWRK